MPTRDDAWSFFWLVAVELTVVAALMVVATPRCLQSTSQYDGGYRCFPYSAERFLLARPMLQMPRPRHCLLAT